MSNQGQLVILSGYSGSGKGTIMNELLSRFPKDYALSISATTRNPRPGEEEGVAYFFKSREEFTEMIEAGDLLEHAEYAGNYYGTPLSYVKQKLSEGTNVILEIEQQGAFKVKKKLPDTRLIFLTPPSADELVKRLEGRGTETSEVIRQRLETAIIESDHVKDYDYLMINDILEESVNRVHNLIMTLKEGQDASVAGYRCDREENKDLISDIKENLQVYLKGEK